MTALKAVADDVLGHITRKVWDLLRRILEGALDPERVLAILQLAQEGVPNLSSDLLGKYLLESRWDYHSSHQEFATISFERGELDISLEELLRNPSVLPEENKQSSLKMLELIFGAQVPRRGSYKMLRLYRVMGVRYFGYNPNFGRDGRLERDVVDIHLILKPVCDFNDQGKPIPCAIKGA